MLRHPWCLDTLKGASMLATEWSFGNVLWTIIVLFFWMMAIWLFISLFADIFRRDDLSGWGEAGWVLVLFVVPFLGALIYIIARPKMTAQDRRMLEQQQEVSRRVRGYSPADEIDKLTKLRDGGEISAEDYDRLKRQALMEF